MAQEDDAVETQEDDASAEDQVEEEKSEEASPEEKESGEEAEPEKERPEEKKEEKPAQKIKLRVNKEEKEYTLEEVQDLVNRADLADRSKKKFQEAKELEKAARQTIEAIIDDPIGAGIELLKGKLGDGPRAVKEVADKAEAFLGELLRLQHASPEERERHQLQRELDDKRRRLDELERREAEMKAESIGSSTVAALVKEMNGQGLENDSLSVRLIEEVLAEAIDDEVELPPAEVVELAKKKREELEALLLKKTKADKLKQRAPELVKELRESELAEAKAAQRTRTAPPGRTQRTSPREERRTAPRQAISMAEMDQLIRNAPL